MADDTLSDTQKLRRFLHFGSENNLYRAGGAEFKPLKSAVADTGKIVRELLAAGKGVEVVSEVSRFLTNEELRNMPRGPALWALAICARHQDESKATKQEAMKAFAKCVNSSAELFMFISYCFLLMEKGGWGQSLRKGIRRWFDGRDSKTLAEIVTQQRTGWSWNYQDLLKLAHLKPKTDDAKLIASYIMRGALHETTQKLVGENSSDDLRTTLAYLTAVQELKAVSKEEDAEAKAVALIDKHRLPFWENDGLLQQMPEVLAAYARHIPVKHIVENIGIFAEHKVLESGFPHAEDIAQRISNLEAIKCERISPISLLCARKVYNRGVMRTAWTENSAITDALDKAFVTALQELAHRVPSTDKRYLIAVNINQKHLTGNWTHGSKPLEPINAAAVLALIVAHAELDMNMVYFNTKCESLQLTKFLTLAQVTGQIMECATKSEDPKCDLSAPVSWAQENKKKFDVMIVMTDFRNPKSFKDLCKTFKEYRDELGLPKAKLVVIGLTSSYVYLSNADDPSMLDIAGVDSTVPDTIFRFLTDSF